MDKAAGGWEDQGLTPQADNGAAAEDVATLDVAVRAAVGDIASEEATESRGGRRLRERDR